jgi:hypothetical protein
MLTAQLRCDDDGDWPSGKALGSGPRIGVRTAGGSSPGNLLLKTCFQR